MRKFRYSRTYEASTKENIIVYKLKDQDYHHLVAIKKDDLVWLFAELGNLSKLADRMEYIKIRVNKITLPLGQKLVRDNDLKILIDNSW